jgi:glutamyl-tRNA(Gln) amidotransferase subunit D
LSRNKNKFYELTALSINGKRAASGGYKGKSLAILSGKDIAVGDTISIKTTDQDQVTGILMPRYESADNDHIVIKLKSGYNIGIEITNIQTITKMMLCRNQCAPDMKSKFPDHVKDEITVRGLTHTDNKVGSNSNHLPRIALISTGGTIASRIDYRTGAVHSVLSASDLYTAVPELRGYASVDPEVILNEYSENLKPEHWTLIANKVAEKIRSGK